MIFYNLGKFSQAISDFESIHFHSSPVEKYASFAGFLRHHAESAYPEGWQDNAFVESRRGADYDRASVQRAGVAGSLHPAACTQPLSVARWRRPYRLAPDPGGSFRQRHSLPGGLDDERRLFYVAVTRAQKFLHMSWAPHTGNQTARAPSDFYNEVLASKYVKRRPPDYSARKRLEPRPKLSVSNVTRSFSDMKYFFECPYQFKLRILYGFNAPLDEALGFGKSLHVDFRRDLTRDFH